MNTHAERIAHSRFAGRSPFSRLTAWVSAKREARRARRIEEETIDFLRAMGPGLRDDIGFDIDRLVGSDLMLAKQHPHVLAAMTVTPSQSEPSGRSKRS